VVRGALPDSPPPKSSEPSEERGRWLTPEQARAETSAAGEVQASSRISAGDKELAAALAASLVEAYNSAAGAGSPSAAREDEELSRAIDASLSQMRSGSPRGDRQPAQVAPPPEGADPQPSEALPPPAASSGPGRTFRIAVRLPDGSRVQREFGDCETVGAVWESLAAKGVNPGSHHLATQFPRRTLRDLSCPLKDADISPQETLIVELNR